MLSSNNRFFRFRRGAASEIPVPRASQPGVLAYDTWVAKTDHFLYGMLDFIERVMHENASKHYAKYYNVEVDRKPLHHAFLKYVFRTSINRYKDYDIVE
jgi:hypothetical protein